MTNKKGTQLSEEQKTEIKGIVTGFYDTVEIVPKVSKGDERITEIANSLLNGKYYVFADGTAQQNVYNTLKRLKVKLPTTAFVWAKVKAKDGTIQFAIFVKKD